MQQISEEDAQLLLNIINRSLPTSTFPRTLEKTVYGEENWQEYVGTLSFENQLPEINYVLPHDASDFFGGKKETKLWGLSLNATTNHNEFFSAKQAHITSTKINIGNPEGANSVSIKTSNWHLLNGKVHMWVGILSESIPFRHGNLFLRIPGEYSSSGHFLLEGDFYTYYILHKKEESLLVIKSNEEELDLSKVNRDINVMSFCFGFPLSCKMFMGLDNKGKIVGYAGSNTGFYRNKKNEVKPIIDDENMGAYLSVFFKKITTALTEIESYDRKKNFLFESIWLYVESTYETWSNSAEVKILLACFNAARSLLIFPEKVNKYSNTDKYDHYISDNYLNLPIDVIFDMMLQENLEITEEVHDSLVQSFLLIFGFTSEDIQASRERRKKLYTICIALISCQIEYDGPIHDWKKDSHDVAWWKYKSTTQSVQYEASTSKKIKNTDVNDLWPVFQEPVIPHDSLLQLVDNFARSLAARTDNRVRARFLPIPSLKGSKIQLFDFVIESTKFPLTNNILFTIRKETSVPNLTVTNWDSSGKVIKDERQLILFLTSVATSQRTKEVIERILLSIPNE